MHAPDLWEPRVGRPPRAAAAVRRLLLAVALPATLVATPAAAFDLQGHRGARGLAPENTLAGFRAALAVGVTTLELDTGVTKDGVVVVAHDSELNPNFTRDAEGAWIAGPGPAVRSLTLAELQRYDVGRLKPDTRYVHAFATQRPADGERIPTLSALFEQVARWGAHEVRFNIETKLRPDMPALAPDPEAFARAVLDVVRRRDMLARVTLQSFDWRTLKAARALAPQVELAALTVQSDNFDNLRDGHWTAGLQLADHGGSVPRLVHALGAATWSPSIGNLTEPLVREAQALKLKVVPWTVNEPAAIERALDWGVDGLISDYPDRVRAAMQRRGMPLPRALAGLR